MTLAIWLIAGLAAAAAFLALVRASSLRAVHRSASAAVPAMVVVFAGTTLALATSVSLGDTGVSIMLVIVQELFRAALAPFRLRERDEHGSSDS
jgi:hypothetical protein